MNTITIAPEHASPGHVTDRNSFAVGYHPHHRSVLLIIVGFERIGMILQALRARKQLLGSVV